MEEPVLLLESALVPAATQDLSATDVSLNTPTYLPFKCDLKINVQLFAIHLAKMEVLAHKIFAATVLLVGQEKYAMKVHLFNMYIRMLLRNF